MAKSLRKVGRTVEDQAFEDAVRRLEPRLYRTAMAILWNDADVADAMQECILRAWQKRHTLRDESKLDGWIIRILVNECHSLQRRNRNRPLPLAEGVEAPSAQPADTGLRDALRALPEKFRLPLLLHHLDGYPLEEVARMLRLPESTVRGRIFQARKRLKALLREEAEQ